MASTTSYIDFLMELTGWTSHRLFIEKDILTESDPKALDLLLKRKFYPYFEKVLRNRIANNTLNDTPKDELTRRYKKWQDKYFELFNEPMETQNLF